MGMDSKQGLPPNSLEARRNDCILISDDVLLQPGLTPQNLAILLACHKHGQDKIQYKMLSIEEERKRIYRWVTAKLQ